MAGKKCIGIVRPGNSSGYLISSGSVTENDTMILANERMEKIKLNTISALFFNHFTIAQYAIAANRQTKILAPMILPVFTTFEKSA